MNKMKPIFLKLFLAVILTITVFFFYSRQNQDAVIQEQPPLKDTSVAIDACINEALDGGIDKDRAVNTCECFFRITTENYPENQITNILMATPNPSGNENEIALSNVIHQCMQENLPEIISEPIVEPNLKLDKD